jgi:site-specific recombinase XerD
MKGGAQMSTPTIAPTITIFVRHAEGCKQTREDFKQCNCKKHLRWSHNGKQFRKAAGTRSWAEAVQRGREIEDQLSGRPVEGKTETPKSVDEAARLFIQDKAVQGVGAHLITTYKRELGRLRAYCESQGIYTVQGISRELLTGYCGTWLTVYPSSYTRLRVKERLSGFLTYCFEAQWLQRKPPLPRINVDSAPTMPLTADEYARLLAAVPVAIKDPVEATRARALIQLMRWSGLAIRDAVTLERAEILQANGLHRVVTARQKTGTHVSVPLPPAVALELLAVPNDNARYIFWSGAGSEESFAGTWGTRLVAPVFEAAAIPDVCHMKSHRLRDTFAVDLLQKGIPMEEVSKLLGHESIRTTEKHYAKWVKGRQDRLDALVTGAWAAA